MIDIMTGLLGGGLFLICIGAIALIFIVAVAYTYNSFVVKRNAVQNAWAQIDVQLKKRFDLVPNLVETVKGYAKHEKGVFEEVTRARAAIMSAKTPKETIEANNMLTGALKSLFAVAEAYPDLKANQNFMQLQSELSNIENQIGQVREAYNDSVYSYNTAIQMFPGNLVAGILGFREAEFFKTSEEEAKPIKVEF